MSSLLRLVIAGPFVVLLACEVPLPEGAYWPREEPPSDAGSDDRSPDSDEDIYGDMGSRDDADVDPPDDRELASDDDEGPSDDGTDAPSDDEQTDEDPGDDAEQPDEPGQGATVSPLVGDYWMRADANADASVSSLGVTVNTRTESQVYSLVRVTERSGALELSDFQCAVRMSQRCLSGCTSLSTTFADPARSARAYLPARRALEVDASGRFTASAVPYALGWRGDFSEGATPSLPTSDSDPLVYDPDGGRGKGVDITVRLKPNILPEQVCQLRVVQRIAVRYEGTLREGKLTQATLHDEGSTQNVLASTCRDNDTNSPASEPSAVRLIAAPTPIDAEALPWPCPSLSEFESAFR